MTAPRKSTLTLDAILAWMESGKQYTSGEIADAFGIEPGKKRRQALYELLVRMHHAGYLERHKTFARVCAWEKIVKRAPKVLDTPIAGPRLPPDLSGHLTGYSAELRGLGALAMTARGR